MTHSYFFHSIILNVWQTFNFLFLSTDGNLYKRILYPLVLCRALKILSKEPVPKNQEMRNLQRHFSDSRNILHAVIRKQNCQGTLICIEKKNKQTLNDDE